MNSDLRELQEILIDRVRVLSKQLDNVTKQDTAEKIISEMQEFNHRVTMVGSLIFIQQTQALSDKMEAIRRARSKVDRAIRDIQKLTDMLKLASNFLALVDEVIDLAKTIV